MQGLRTKVITGIADWLDFNASEIAWMLMLVGLVAFFAYLVKVNSALP